MRDVYGNSHVAPPACNFKALPGSSVGGSVAATFHRMWKILEILRHRLLGVASCLGISFYFSAVLESKLSLRENIMTSMLEFAVAAVYAV